LFATPWTANPQRTGVVNASVGQALGSREHIKMAQQFFQLVGASASECDTIPGRQCMASCFFLLKQFDDVNIYLNSIKAYMYNDDDFNWDHGISLAQTGNFKAAEESLLLVQNERYKSEYCYISWLARCYIMNANPRNAWELYLKMDTSNESFNLLQLIANDCYRMGQFLYAAKAFDVLERLDPDPEYWEGKRGACVGVFQQVVAAKAQKEDLRDVLAMVRSRSLVAFPQHVLGHSPPLPCPTLAHTQPPPPPPSPPPPLPPILSF
jgi:intraflagellar transport protein 56